MISREDREGGRRNLKIVNQYAFDFESDDRSDLDRLGLKAFATLRAT
jgi:hypothetical protein